LHKPHLNRHLTKYDLSLVAINTSLKLITLYETVSEIKVWLFHAALFIGC